MIGVVPCISVPAGESGRSAESVPSLTSELKLDAVRT